jgi:Tfp pilus assembly protein PilO
MKINFQKLDFFGSNFTREQKKIIYIALLVLAFLIVFWVFIYIPESRKYRQQQEEIRQTEGQVAEITQIAAGRELGRAVRDLRLELGRLLNRLPAQDETAIAAISQAAKKRELSLKSINPRDEKVVDAGIGGYTIKELPISLSLVAEYRSLGEFLNDLAESSDIFVRLRSLRISGSGEGQLGLDVQLELSAYLSEPK